MRILQIVSTGTPSRLAKSGGDLRMFQEFLSLRALGHEVHLAVVGSPGPIEDEVRAQAASVHHLTANLTPWQRGLARVLHPETFELRFVAESSYATAAAQVARSVKPDVIWADCLLALAASPYRSYPVVYSHQDFMFRTKGIRRGISDRHPSNLQDVLERLRKRIRRPEAMSLRALERHELALIRRATHVVCVSASEAEDLRSRGIAADYIPIAGPTIPRSVIQPPADKARFFFFGFHNTAHASMLAELRHHLWPLLANAGCVAEWHQAGRPPLRPDEDWKWMERTFDVVHGYVDDLGSLFRRGDVSVAPYSHDTGFRTKFTVTAAHGMINAGYLSTFRCAPEFTPGVDCVASADAESLAATLCELARDPRRREQLGDAARALYERAYTLEAHTPEFAEILATAVRAPRVSA